MLKYLAAFLLTFCAYTQEETIEKLIIRLGNEDFEERVKATEKLSAYPREYAFIFNKLADGFDYDPEIKWRLQHITKLIIANTDYANDERYKRSTAWIGIEFSWHYGAINSEEDADQEVTGLKINGVTINSPADGIIEIDDIIREINGVPAAKILDETNAGYGLFQKDKEYTIKIQRPNIEKEEYEEVIVKIKAQDRPEHMIPWGTLEEVYNEVWVRFQAEYLYFFSLGKEIPNN